MVEPELLSEEDRDRAARRLVDQANVPLVIAAGGEDYAWAWNARGKFRFPEEAPDVLGPSHPLSKAVAEDVVRLCHHPEAGELVLSGWRPEGRALSLTMRASPRRVTPEICFDDRLATVG